MAKKQAGWTTRAFQILSILGGAAFFYWLYTASEPTEFAVAEEGVQEIEAVDVTPAEFLADPVQFEGETVRLAPVEVTQLLRQNVYFVWFGEGDGGRVLVRMSDDLAGEPGFQPLPADTGELVGTVQLVTEELIEQWNQAGVFREAQELLDAQAQSVYVFVIRADLTPAESAGSPDADDGDDTDG